MPMASVLPVLLTEELSGRCLETREGQVPLDPRPLTVGTPVGAALRALLRLSSLSLCHHLNLKT